MIPQKSGTAGDLESIIEYARARAISEAAPLELSTVRWGVAGFRFTWGWQYYAVPVDSQTWRNRLGNRYIPRFGVDRVYD